MSDKPLPDPELGSPEFVWAQYAYTTLRLMAVSDGVSPLSRLMATQVVAVCPDSIEGPALMHLDVSQAALGQEIPPLDPRLVDVLRAMDPDDMSSVFEQLAQETGEADG